MPTITVNTDDISLLLGTRLKESDLNGALSSLKCEVELVSGKEMTYEVTSDRPDLFGSEGLARAVRGLLGLARPVEAPPAKRSDALKVGKSVSGIRPFIVAATVSGIKFDDESLKQVMQLQERLHGTYGAGRKKASIGIYDLDKVKPPLRYEALRPEGISFVPLESEGRMTGREILEKTPKGREYASILKGFPRYPLLTDSEGRVLSMPPIINSEHTRLGTGTKNVLIDVTGTNEAAINLCLNVLVTSLQERSGRVGRVDVAYPGRHIITPNLSWVPITLSIDTVRRISGLELDAATVGALLRRMGMKTSVRRGKTIGVLVPPYRFDIMHEVDLVEDVIMAYGLNDIAPNYPPSPTIGKSLSGSRLRGMARDLMVGMGFQEISTYMLTNLEASKKSMADGGPLAEVVKPVSVEYAAVRGSLIPKLLMFLGSNTHHPYPQRIFEYGDVVNVLDGQAVTSTRLSSAISDHSISFEEIQAVSSSLLRNLSIKSTYGATVGGPFIIGRCAKVLVERKPVGMIGEVTPGVLQEFGIGCPTAIMELDISKLLLLESLFRG